MGKPIDSLSAAERLALAGKWIALERYSPVTLAMRMIEAIGTSPAECVRQLSARGLDPRNFEFQPLRGPW